MTSRSIFARAAELEAAGRPFAVATVVAVRRPTSARPGASGIVHPDGAIEGWVGGELRPAGRRPRGAPCARGRPAAPAAAVEGRARRGPPGRRRHRTGHDLPLRWHAGDLRGTAHRPPHNCGSSGRRRSPERSRARFGRRLAGDRHRPDRRGRRVPRRRPGPRLGRHPGTRPGGVAVRRRRHAGDLGRGGGRAGTHPRGLVRRASSHRRRGPASSATGSARRRPSATSGSPRCAPRPVSTSGPRRPRRSRCPSWPSWSRCDAAGRTSWPRPVRRRWRPGCRTTSRSSRSSTTSSCSIRSAA